MSCSLWLTEAGLLRNSSRLERRLTTTSPGDPLLFAYGLIDGSAFCIRESTVCSIRKLVLRISLRYSQHPLLRKQATLFAGVDRFDCVLCVTVLIVRNVARQLIYAV
jgi:hypothetical protein